MNTKKLHTEISKCQICKEFLPKLPKPIVRFNTNSKIVIIGQAPGNVVHQKDDAQKTLSVSYTELIPVLINAIKEQQKIIDTQNSNYVSLLKRIETLESNVLNNNVLKTDE